MLVTGQKVLQKLRNNSELCLRFSSDFWRLPNLQNIEKIALKTKVTANDVLILGIRYIQKLNLDCHCPQIWIHSGLSKNTILSFFFAKSIIYGKMDTCTVVVVLTQTFASCVRAAESWKVECHHYRVLSLLGERTCLRKFLPPHCFGVVLLGK